MDLAAFDYDLPEQAIAQTPIEPRDRARLLVDRGRDEEPDHRSVADLPTLLGPGDVLVLNTTRVLPARLKLHKPTGGAVEVLLLERQPEGHWDALVKPSRRVPPGTVLHAGDDLDVELRGEGTGEGTRQVVLHLHGRGERHRAAAVGTDADRWPPQPTGSDEARQIDELAVLARHGVVPLPPYITAPLADPERYQTVYADRSESVAAPTAGLHLTPTLLDACRAAGAEIVTVELAVGLGTFRPMTADKVEDHEMHAERYRVPTATLEACRAADRVVAVGTTAVRALESAAQTGRLEGRTELFIRRPYDWQLVDVLLTNFHLPRSSLLVLVDAFVGARWRDLYALALDDGYRFLSFGDAMLLARGTDPADPADPGAPA
ncbi:MAG TPA: S-adenosylmethionine:tRNA ribosyltransferase-isomerase [Acidimicrobiales bacterium]|jgi:S-adenosylmethionine:tRNA ribosyltransferase-isomerase|nr:S-adenosylmethionine:tRNA ribosyltransferase-isomerase [Acidimicrobiales bacterium]